MFRDCTSFAVRLVLPVLACSAIVGCRFLPPNYLGLVTAERAGPHPKLLSFSRGLALEDTGNDRGVTLLAGRDVLLLFDYRGNTNRVQLLFCNDGDRVLYERSGSVANHRRQSIGDLRSASAASATASGCGVALTSSWPSPNARVW